MKDIVINKLDFSYEDKIIFHNFSTVFQAGKINVLLGESGIGKTTLLNCIIGLLKYEGTIDNIPPDISCIFQNSCLIPDISVYKNLNLILKEVYKSKDERRNKIFQMLRLLEIAEIADRFPTEISGGQAQRVAIARAFLYPSSLLILDEAFKEMDGSLKERLIKSFLNLWEKDKRTVIMVTHNRKEAAMLADNIKILSANPAVITKEINVCGEKGHCSRLPSNFFTCDLN